ESERAAASGIAVYGAPVALGAGRTVSVGGWGRVTAQKTVGRLTAPLVVQLLAAHPRLPAGATIAFAFGASAEVVHTKQKHHSGTHAGGGTQNGGGSSEQGAKSRKHRQHKHAVAQPPPGGARPGHHTLATH